MSEKFSGNIIIMFPFLLQSYAFCQTNSLILNALGKYTVWLSRTFYLIKWGILGRTVIRFCYLHSPYEPQKKGVYSSHNFISLFFLTYLTSWIKSANDYFNISERMSSLLSPIYSLLSIQMEWKFVKSLFSILTKFDVNPCIFNEVKSFNEKYASKA